MKRDLTGSQVKALLIVASQSRPETPGPCSELLERAIGEATSVEDLVRIKNHAKALIKEAADTQHREAAQLLYHTAVAAAFVRHATEISGRPLRKQQPLYERFASAWAGDKIGDLFREAARRVADAHPRE